LLELPLLSSDDNSALELSADDPFDELSSVDA
jgi:hypothetical protein